MQKPLIFTCAILFLIVPIFLLGQPTLEPEMDADSKKLFLEGKKAAQLGDLQKSNKIFENLLKKNGEFIEVMLRLASNYYSLKQYDKAETLFKQAITKQPEYNSEMYFSLAMVQEASHKYLEAAHNYKIYASTEKTNEAKVIKADTRAENLVFTDAAMRAPVPFKPKALGTGINTSFSEYAPLLSLDGSALIFTRNDGQEDLFISSLDSNLVFQKADPVEGINTHQNEGTFSISADGRLIVYAACDRKDVFGSCDLYYSMMIQDEWTNPVNMGHHINSAAWDSQPTLSVDGRILIFSSKRKGGYGGSDLWMTFRNDSDKWVSPFNLGPQINSKGDDESPFLHADGQSLYFRSNGRIGLGNFDIYLSKKNDSTQLWTTPINLGYPINTSASEGSLSVSLDGKKAYFSSDFNFETKQKLNQLDIFEFDLYEKVRPNPTTFIKGIVTDKATSKPVNATIQLIDVSNGKAFSKINTDLNGYFIGGITIGKNYAFVIQHQDYQYYAENIDLTVVNQSLQAFVKDVALLPLPSITHQNTEIKPIVLQNIFFQSASDRLLQTSYTEINLLADWLKQHPEKYITIIGHTDDVGTEADNVDLSQRRAKSVVDALMKLNIDASRISYIGKGESEPIGDNATEEGRQKNRRTEMIWRDQKQ